MRSSLRVWLTGLLIALIASVNAPALAQEKKLPPSSLGQKPAISPVLSRDVDKRPLSQVNLPALSPRMRDAVQELENEASSMRASQETCQQQFNGFRSHRVATSSIWFNCQARTLAQARGSTVSWPSSMKNGTRWLRSSMGSLLTCLSSGGSISKFQTLG